MSVVSEYKKLIEEDIVKIEIKKETKEQKPEENKVSETKELNKNLYMSDPIEKTVTEQIAEVVEPVIEVKPVVKTPIEEEIEEIRTDLNTAIEKNNVREIFDYFDISVFINKDGTYGLSEFRQPTNYITYSDIGINEEKLMQNVSKISGNADFRKSSLTSFGKIQSIGGYANFSNSNFKPNMKLPKIKSKIIFYENQSLIQGVWFKFKAWINELLSK